MVVINKNLVPKGYIGITLYPFIIARDQEVASRPDFINHEKIHLAQQKELLIVFFFLWYLIEFIIGFFKYGNWNKAYRAISFERESYTNESNLNYLSSRRFYAFKNYI